MYIGNFNATHALNTSDGEECWQFRGNESEAAKCSVWSEVTIDPNSGTLYVVAQYLEDCSGNNGNGYDVHSSAVYALSPSGTVIWKCVETLLQLWCAQAYSCRNSNCITFE